MADFLTLSPEVNSARMYAGGGPGSLSAAAAAWDELAAELWLAAASFESVSPAWRTVGGKGRRLG